jgi:hypothetical protein
MYVPSCAFVELTITPPRITILPLNLSGSLNKAEVGSSPYALSRNSLEITWAQLKRDTIVKSNRNRFIPYYTLWKLSEKGLTKS